MVVDIPQQCSQVFQPDAENVFKPPKVWRRRSDSAIVHSRRANANEFLWLDGI